MWASTSTKNPLLPDTYYVDNLIGPDTVNTLPDATIAAFEDRGTRIRVLCFTQGEASTLGDTARSLGEVRAEELRAAADVLGVVSVELLSYPDGHLQEVPLEELAGRVEDVIADADLLLVFDEDGITGHPDHCRATEAALEAATKRQMPVLAWALPEGIASQLNIEFGTGFVGRAATELDIIIKVDRVRQCAAISCHITQSHDNPVLRRRLDLLRESEHLRWLNRPLAPSFT